MVSPRDVTALLGGLESGDRTALNLLLPLVWTSLGPHGATAAIVSTSEGEMHAVGEAGFDGSAFGVGDILLRTKYRFWDGAPARVAAGFSLRVPSGSEGDFQGLGDVLLTNRRPRQ